MGIVFERDYNLIIKDLMEAIQKVENFYEFIDMNQEEWNALGKDEQRNCIRAMSNDVFYGLGGQPVLRMGAGVVSYNHKKGYIKVYDGEKCTEIIPLN